MIEQRPKVGVGIMIIKDNKILLGKRLNAHGHETWSFPGGHLEYSESVRDCAIREVKEETGLNIEMIDEHPVKATNDIFKKEGKHYITLFLRAKHKSGNPEVKEPNKCEKWEWFEWDNLPQSLFLPIQNLKKQNYNPLK